MNHVSGDTKNNMLKNKQPRLEESVKNHSLTQETAQKFHQNDRWQHRWGFKDTAFIMNADRTITMTGNRYPLSGKLFDRLLPFIEESFGMQVSDERSDALVVEVLPPIKNSEFCAAIAQKFPVSQYSFSDCDRQHHSHGQTPTEEIYPALYTHLKRIVDCVFYCESESDVQQIIHLANEFGVCLIPFGGGTNVSCALQIPDQESRMTVAVNMQRMNQIEWIDPENLRACVQAGITGTQLENLLQQAGFICGHEPDSLEFSTLGGWISTHASGMKKNRYGNIEDIVENITMITPMGRLEQTQPLARVSMGMQPQHLLFGSEGNLGIITKAVIKIHPSPEMKEYTSVLFHEFDQGVEFLYQLAHSGALPASVRLVDNSQFRFAQALKPKMTGWQTLYDRINKFYALTIRRFDPSTMVAATIVLEGSTQEVSYQKATLKRLAKQHHGLLAGAKNGQRGYMLTFAIAYIRDFLFKLHILGETFETTVPWSQVQQVCKSIEEALHQAHREYHLPGQPYLSYRVTQLYHTSVCIYFTLGLYMKDVDKPDHILSQIEHSLRQTIIDHGGSISHHHGVGKLRSQFLKNTLSPVSLEVLKGLKNNIDPNNIFGIRNNIFLDQEDIG
jgi:alkyldihydroxyacetonephosphate synthase